MRDASRKLRRWLFCFLSGCIEGTLQVWDLDTFSEAHSKKIHDDFVTQLLHSPSEWPVLCCTSRRTLGQPRATRY